MPSLNKVMLIGNLTRDPQLKYLPSQTAVTEFGLAINRKFKSNGEAREEVLFVDCTVFGKPAEVVNQYVKKGDPLFVEGRLKYDTWESDGGKRSKISVVVEQFQFISSNKQSSSDPPPYNEDKKPKTQKPFKEDDTPF